MKSLEKVFLVFFLLLINTPLFAATYYVNATGGNDTRTTTQAQVVSTPWATIQKCGTNAKAGDICLVLAGTYNERVTVANSGTASAYVTFAAYKGQKVVMRGFTISDKSFVRIVGFEITHVNTTYSAGVLLTGTVSYVEILNNYIHHVNSNAVRGAYSAIASYITVRGNEIYYAGCVTEGVICSGNGWAVGAGIASSYWLIEYNNAHRCGDFINLYGHHHIVRNNYLYDYKDSYFITGGGHVDMFQPGSDGIDTKARYHVYESNFMGDNLESNSHAFQWRDTVAAGDQEVISRGSVMYNFGSYIAQSGGVDKTRYYNNTFYNFSTKVSSSATMMYYNTEGSNGSTGNHNFNNIFHTIPLVSDVISTETGSSVAASNNVCYSTRKHASCVSTGDPSFVSIESRKFQLQSDSPAIGAGKAITTVTSAAGSGTTVTLADANMFIDGYGLVAGDKIKIGSNDYATITSISGNNVTVNRSITWKNGDPVYWRNQDTSPDIGAYEYRADGYRLTGTYGLSNGTVTVTPSDASLVRFVEVWENGTLKGTDSTPPFTVSGVGSGTLSVKMYSLFASSTPVVTATESGGIMAVPQNFKITLP